MMQTARVISATLLSPTVKHLRLQLVDPAHKVTFKPGQWVDFTPPELGEEVAGYSITSTPKLLADKSQFDLSIQLTNHSVSKWVHHSCNVNDTVLIKVGGDFCLTEERLKQFSSFLLVGGGVGINPIYSMMNYLAENKSPGQVHLLYSAKSPEEFLFQSEIESLVASNRDKITAEFFLTKPDNKKLSNQIVAVNERRIRPDDLKSSLERICPGSFSKDNLKQVGCFLCGPSVMIDEVEKVLLQYLQKDQIFYENWYTTPDSS